VNEFVEAANENQVTRTINRYGKADPLIVDEFGYRELNKHGSGLLPSKSSPNEKRRTAPRSRQTKHSEEETRTFTNPQLCTTIVDTLTFNATSTKTSTEYPPTQPRPPKHHHPTPPQTPHNRTKQPQQHDPKKLLTKSGELRAICWSRFLADDGRSLDNREAA
jgi:hypothetical protein